MQGSKKAKFGRSKEKRNDAKIIVLALVVNKEGFLKYSDIFEGNMSDCKTLETISEKLSSQTSYTSRKPIVVIDAGIATEDNIKMLKQKGFDYLCITRSGLKGYYADVDNKSVQIRDKKKQQIELIIVKTAKNDDKYLWVRSEAKALKENSMNGLLA